MDIAQLFDSENITLRETLIQLGGLNPMSLG